MRLLLTSGGIANASIHDTLVELLGKPVAESSALFVPTATYPFPGGTDMAWQAICGKTRSPLCGLGWKSLGVLELTALPTTRPPSRSSTARSRSSPRGTGNSCRRARKQRDRVREVCARRYGPGRVSGANRGLNSGPCVPGA
jgi:hypothetical protein